MNYNILLFEDNEDHAQLLQDALDEHNRESYQLTVVSSLSQGTEQLNLKSDFNVVLLDLNLEDSRGLETLTKLVDKQRELPVVVLTSLDDEDLALKSLNKGAQDYLCKQNLSGDVVWRAIKHSISRKLLGLANEKNYSLEEFNRLAVGREMRIIELKKQVNTLSTELGRPQPYDLSFAEE